VCVFVKKDLCLIKIDISVHFKEEDLEICAIQLETKSCMELCTEIESDYKGIRCYFKSV
jgi:hypothetical protein